MGGVWAYVLRHGNLLDAVDYLRHDPFKYAAASRGPDKVCDVEGADYHLVFHRLAVHDLSDNADQPFCMEWGDGTTMHLMCNGEIYNYEALIQQYSWHRIMNSKSDCEVIGHMLQMYNGDVHKVCCELHGEFAFVARLEKPSGEVCIVAARDTFGVRPMYYAETNSGILFSSLLSGIAGFQENSRCHHFPPGKTYTEVVTNPDCKPVWTEFTPYTFPIPGSPAVVDHGMIAVNALVQATAMRLTGEREIGFMLSGGLKSSMIVAIATKLLGMKAPHTFCFGFDKQASDIVHARIVAKHLGTTHHEVIVKPSDALCELRDMIRTLETYDLDTVREGVVHYFVAKAASNKTGVKILLSGDETRENTVQADRCFGAVGIEARLPMLDTHFVKALRCCDFHDRSEFRDAFEKVYPGLLPQNVVYRSRHCITDCITSSLPNGENAWISLLRSTAHKKHEDELRWYRSLFDTCFAQPVSL